MTAVAAPPDEPASSRPPSPGWSWPRVRRAAAVAGLLGAEVIHTAVLGEHLRGFVVDGLFFFALSLAEGAAAVALLLRPGPRSSQAAFDLSFLTLILWAFSRTVGLPPGAPEPVGRADAVATLLETVTCLTLAPVALAPPARRWLACRRHELAAAALALAVALVSSWGLTGGHRQGPGPGTHDRSRFLPDR